jgi:hypothetical protein
MNLFKDLLSSVLWPSSFEGVPAGGESLGLGDDRIRNVVKATRERLEHEHIKDMTTGTPAQDGWHRQGSAKCYFQTDPPETRPDGVTALTVEDNGREWIHSGNYREYVYHHAAGSTPATRWVVRTAILGGNNTFSGNNVFSGNVSLGDLISLNRSSCNIFGTRISRGGANSQAAIYNSLLAALGFTSDPTEYFQIPCNGFIRTTDLSQTFPISRLYYDLSTYSFVIYYVDGTNLAARTATKGSATLFDRELDIVIPRYIERRSGDTGV